MQELTMDVIIVSGDEQVPLGSFRFRGALPVPGDKILVDGTTYEVDARVFLEDGIFVAVKAPLPTGIVLA